MAEMWTCSLHPSDSTAAQHVDMSTSLSAMYGMDALIEPPISFQSDTGLSCTHESAGLPKSKAIMPGPELPGIDGQMSPHHN